MKYYHKYQECDYVLAEEAPPDIAYAYYCSNCKHYFKRYHHELISEKEYNKILFSKKLEEVIE